MRAFAALERAQSLWGNWRNTESVWGPLYRVVMDQLLRHAGSGFDVLQEVEVWNPTISIDENQRRKTMHFNSNNIKWVRPDLLVCLYILHRLCHETGRLPVYGVSSIHYAIIIELKHAVAREWVNDEGLPNCTKGM